MTDYLQILKEELILALGCTEPIAIALAAANAASLVPEKPQTIEVFASGSIIKNANSVYVPNSGGQQGVLIAAALGALVAKPDLQLQVLEAVTETMREEAKRLVADKKVTLQLQKQVDNVYIKMVIKTQNHRALAVISHAHTHVSRLEKDGQVLLEQGIKGDAQDEKHADRSGMTLRGIYDYATTVSFEEHPELVTLFEQQIDTNIAIAQEGLQGEWGQEVGKTLHMTAEGNPALEAIALAAAGSDARMAGCVSPVTINAGSGNQGITCSVPVIHMANSMGVSKEQLYRALALSNLIAIYEKQFIGKLSAFCGAVSAAAAAGCGIALLKGFDFEQIEMTLTNTLAASGGIICDGAKGSCAMKIAVALQNANLSLQLGRRGKVFLPGDGIVGDTTEDTLRHIGTLAVEGMVPTDQTILKIMTQKSGELDINK